MGKENNQYKTTPWLKHYYAARSRCFSGKYKGFVDFLMKREEFKDIWFRDEAYNLESPSIDRIDTNEGYLLDNCRFIENSENKRRPRRASSSSKSNFKGVYWQEDHNKFRVCITLDGKLKHMGYFSDEKEAAMHYNKCVSELFGEEININKV